MKIAKATLCQEALGNQQRRVSSKKSARLREAAFSLRSQSSCSGEVGGDFFQQTHEKCFDLGHVLVWKENVAQNTS